MSGVPGAAGEDVVALIADLALLEEPTLAQVLVHDVVHRRLHRAACQES